MTNDCLVLWSPLLATLHNVIFSFKAFSIQPELFFKKKITKKPLETQMQKNDNVPRKLFLCNNPAMDVAVHFYLLLFKFDLAFEKDISTYSSYISSFQHFYIHFIIKWC